MENEEEAHLKRHLHLLFILSPKEQSFALCPECLYAERRSQSTKCYKQSPAYLVV